MPRIILGLALALSATSAWAADAGHGRAVFSSNCSSCHSQQAGKTVVGPSLFGVMGRKAGSQPGFSYSKAMLGSGVTWSADKLDAYITAPQKFIPGVKMPFAGLNKATDRADLIAYLATLK